MKYWSSHRYATNVCIVNKEEEEIVLGHGACYKKKPYLWYIASSGFCFCLFVGKGDEYRRLFLKKLLRMAVVQDERGGAGCSACPL